MAENCRDPREDLEIHVAEEQNGRDQLRIGRSTLGLEIYVIEERNCRDHIGIGRST